jgi:hypothetical protein
MVQSVQFMALIEIHLGAQVPESLRYEDAQGLLPINLQETIQTSAVDIVSMFWAAPVS